MAADVDVSLKNPTKNECPVSAPVLNLKEKKWAHRVWWASHVPSW